MDNSKLQETFYKARDSIYSIPNNTCIHKNSMIVSAAQDAGYQARPRVAMFRFEDIEGIPKEVLDMPHFPEHPHMYAEILMEDWINVDATWDCGLEAILPVNSWDGESSTILAVPTTKVLGPEESIIYIQGFKPEDIPKIMGANPLYEGFNSWLESVRSK